MMGAETLTPAAAAELAALHAACFAAGEAWSEKSFASQMADLGSFGWLLRRDGSAVAAVVVRLVADEAEILTLCTDAAHRRQGFSRWLLQQAGAEAAARGAHTLHLEVAADNDAALALYGAQGFKPVGQRPAYYERAGGAVAALLLAKAL